MAREHEPVIATPILPVGDMKAAAAFYTDLGFSIDEFSSDYVIVLRDGHELLHLTASDAQSTGVVYLNVRNADDWHARCIRAGHTPGPIADREWGMREFSVTDPSGNTLRIGTNT